MAIKITCVHRKQGYENPYDGIHTLGWENDVTKETGRCGRDEMVSFIEKFGNRAAYIEDAGKIVSVCPISSVFSLRKSLRTYTGKEFTDHLLHMPDCQ